jgi:excisionase family DNA binding protein
VSGERREKLILAIGDVLGCLKAMLEDERAAAAEPAPADEILSLAEAAAELREPVTTVRVKCQRGDIRAEKRGKLWKVSRAELARYRARCARRGRLRAVEGKPEA